MSHPATERMVVLLERTREKNELDSLYDICCFVLSRPEMLFTYSRRYPYAFAVNNQDITELFTSSAALGVIYEQNHPLPYTGKQNDVKAPFGFFTPEEIFEEQSYDESSKILKELYSEKYNDILDERKVTSKIQNEIQTDADFKIVQVIATSFLFGRFVESGTIDRVALPPVVAEEIKSKYLK